MVVVDVSVHRWEFSVHPDISGTTDNPDKSGWTVTIRFYVCTISIIFLPGL